jgi:hypothetical protein
MKRFFYLSFLLLGLLHAGDALGQVKEKILAEADGKKLFDKKFRWGISWNQYWGIINGNNLPQKYFSKPCIGFNLRAEYYPLSFIGIGAGLGIQQRGAGIINPDNYGGAYTHPWIIPQDADSTYRERLRFNTIELPITLLLRTPKDVIKGMRVSAGAGVVFTRVSWAKDVFLSVEDGLHKITDVSKDYSPSDIGYQLSVGSDINAGESCILQVHFVYTKGGKNIYRTGSGVGRLETYGFRVAWLF